MIIRNVTTGEACTIEVVPLAESDFQFINKKRYFFNWKLEKGFEIYKLQILGSNDILGLVSIQRIPEEWRCHIRLLTVSIENCGSQKSYDDIAGNLLACIARIALRDYGELGCISLKPKTQIANHYVKKYNMNVTGTTLSIEMPELLALINTYYHD